MTNEEPVDTTQYMEVQHDGSVIEKRETIFDEDEYIINIGPQHPATHGVLRFRVSLEGEIIKKLDVHCGYIHRGIEKDVRKSDISPNTRLNRPVGLFGRTPKPPCTLHVYRKGNGCGSE